MLTVFSLSVDSPSMNVTHTPIASIARICWSTLVLRKDLIVQAGRIEDFIEHDDAVGGHDLAGMVKANEVVLQFSPKVGDILFALEMREDLVGQKETSVPARDRTSQPRKEMQLAEHPREGGLAALVRSGHDNQTFGAGPCRQNRCRRRSDSPGPASRPSARSKLPDTFVFLSDADTSGWQNGRPALLRGSMKER